MNIKTLTKFASSAKLRGITAIAEYVPYNNKKYAGHHGYSITTSDDNSHNILSKWSETVETIMPVPNDLYLKTADFMRLDDYNPKKGTLESKYLRGAASFENGRVYGFSPERVIPFDMTNSIPTDFVFHHCKSNFDTTYKSNARFYPHPIEINGTVASLLAGGGSGINIAHWMLDVIPRLDSITKIIPLQEIDYYLIPGHPTSYKTDSLATLGISKSQLIFVTKQLFHYRANKMVFGTPPRSHNKILTPAWVNQFHRDTFLKKADSITRDFPKKVYISRRDSPLRGVSNEYEVINTLRKQGYKEIVLSDYSYLEKIAIFKNAESIVTMSGAALAFLMYCKPGTTILEIFPGNFVHYVYYNLAYLNHLDYRYLIFGKTSTDAGRWFAQRDSLHIDIDSMCDALTSTHNNITMAI